MGPRRHGQRRGAALPHSAAMTPRTAEARTPLGGSPLCSACSTAWPAPMSGSMAAGGRSAGRPGHPGTSRHGPLRAGGQESATPSGGSSVRSSRWYRRGPVPGGARLRLRQAGRHRRDHLPARRPRRAGRRDGDIEIFPARGWIERVVADRRIVCLSAEAQRLEHRGYPPRASDSPTSPPSPTSTSHRASTRRSGPPHPERRTWWRASRPPPGRLLKPFGAWPLPPPTRPGRCPPRPGRRGGRRARTAATLVARPVTAASHPSHARNRKWYRSGEDERLLDSGVLLPEAVAVIVPERLWKHSSPVGSVPFSGLSSTYP